MKYIGKGYWLPGIPARDLTPEEVKKHGKATLLETGLYEEIKPAKKKKPPAKKDKS